MKKGDIVDKPIRHFRFPVFSDAIGAKDPNYESPFEKQVTHIQSNTEEKTIEIEEKPIIDEDSVKRQSFHSASTVHEALADKQVVVADIEVDEYKLFATSTPTAFKRQESISSNNDVLSKKEAQEKIKENREN